MKRLTMPAILGSLATIVLGGGLGLTAPLKGARAFYQEIGSHGNFELKDTFRAGERACVIVRGDHRPVVDLSVTVYDDQDKLVAQDNGPGDFVAAIWYPRRDSSYKIKIHNPGVEFNRCYIAVK